MRRDLGMCVSEKEIATYNTLNRLSRRDSVVILGSTYFREMPVGELKQAFGILVVVKNSLGAYHLHAGHARTFTLTKDAKWQV